MLLQYRLKSTTENFIFIFLKIIYFILVQQTFRVVSKNCLQMYENCDGSPNDCQLDIIIMKKMCGDFLNDDTIFDGCNRQNELSCKGAIKTLNTKHGFKGCHCSGYGSNSDRNKNCEVLLRMLTAHPCLLYPPIYLPDIKSSEIESFKNPTKPNEIELDKLSNKPEFQVEPISTNKYENFVKNGLRVSLGSLGLFAETGLSKSTSCISRQETCHQDQNCYNSWNNFKASCQFHTCDKTGDQCVASYEELRRHGMFDCVCVPFHQLQPTHMKTCLDIQTSLLDNQCLAFLNNRVMYQTLTFGSPDNSRKTESGTDNIPKQLQSLSKEIPNCLSSYQLCTQSSVCLQRYMEIEKHCSTCRDYAACLRAVRIFYSKPDAISLNSIRCQCNRSSFNDPCHRQQQMFQPSCVKRGPRPTINCLLIMQACLNDTACLDSFTVFSQLCTPSLNGSLTCPNNYFRCVDAYRTIWGSILKSECSCNEKETIQIASNNNSWAQNPLKICQFFRNMLSRPFCIFPDESSTEKNENKPNINIPINDENDPCLILSKHNLPKNGLIRIETSSKCPMVCKCGENCETLPCSSNNISVALTCDLLKLSHQHCQCSGLKIICSNQKSNDSWKYKDSGYKLLIQFNKKELILITRHNNLFGIQSIISSLNSLMKMSTGLKHCRLIFYSVDDSFLTFILEINLQRSSIQQVQFSYKYWPPSNEERIGHLTAECVLSAKLLQLMINRNYPEIQHNLPLSILQKAEIIVPPQLPQLPQVSISPSGSHNGRYLSNLPIKIIFQYIFIVIFKILHS